MSKKLLFIVAAIIIVGAIAGYLFAFKDKESFSLLPSFLKSSERDLTGLWKLEKQIYWYPTTGEFKEMPPSSEPVYQYIEFKSDSQFCFGGQLDAKGQLLPCDENGTFRVDGDTLIFRRADTASTKSADWEIKDGKLIMTIDVTRPVDEPLLKLKNVFTKIEVQAPPSPPPQAKRTEDDNILDNWQTYESKEFGFSIKYPPGYIQTEVKEPDEDIITFGPKQGEEGWQMFVVVREGLYEEAIEEFRKMTPGIIQERSRNIRGINGVEFTVEFQRETDVHKIGTWFIIPYHNGGLGFVTTAPDKTTLEKEVAPLFNQFISSFLPQI